MVNFVRINGEKRVIRKFLPGKSSFCVKLSEKNQNVLEICHEKSRFFVKLPEKIEIFRKFDRKNLNLFDPNPQPPRFQTRLTSLPLIITLSFSKIAIKGRKADSSFVILKPIVGYMYIYLLRLNFGIALNP